MKQKNNNKIVITLFIVIIIILSTLCVLFATNVISFSSNSAIKDNESNDNVQNNDDAKNDDWISYLLCAKDVKATLTRYFNEDVTESEEIKKVLNTIELEDYLTNLNKCKCHNVVNQDGFGGPTQYNVDITYTVNDIEYSFLLNGGYTFFVTGTEKKVVDKELVKLLTQAYPEEKLEYVNDSGTHVFRFDGICAVDAIKGYFEQ